MSASAKPKAFPRPLLWTWLVALVAAPILLWILPADYFDEGQSMCPSILLFDTECPGCGSTRAVQHLHHADFDMALYFHAAAPFIYLALVLIWCLWTYQTATRLGLMGQERALALEDKLRSQAERRIERKQALRGER